MRILYIEDQKTLREAVAKHLTEQGFIVDSSGDGKEGLFMAVENDYDAIVLDIMLPGLDGLEFIRKIRQQDSETPILVVSARDKIDQRVEGLQLGADDYLVKPFALVELVARVQALLRRKYGDRRPVLSFEDLTLDTMKKLVQRGGRLIELTAREYALLDYLMRRQGEIVSRTDIWNHIYEYQSTATSNVVDVYVGYLRSKLNAGDRPNLIQTRRGFGYVLEYPKP
ncbi:MAG: DNA-binding response OmpR family regulator [Verrucomicrobiales bacterium]|jgi:DNA-binding response OmpR family regulator